MAINPGLYNLDNSFFNSTTPQPLAMVRAVVQVLALSNDIAAFSVLSVFLRTVALILVCLKVISSVREDVLGFNVMRLRNTQKLQVRSYGTEWVAYPLLFLSTIAFPAQVMLTAAHGILSAEMEMGEVILASVEILFILELDDQVVAQGISSVFPRTLQLSDIKVPKSCLKKSDTEAIIDECIRLGANSASFELEGGKYKEVQRKDFDKFKRQTVSEILDGITTNLMKGALPFLFTFATPALFLGILGCLVFGMEFIDFDQQDAASFQFHMHLPMGVVLVRLASGLSGCAVAFAMVTTEAIGVTACGSKDCCDEMSLIWRPAGLGLTTVMAYLTIVGVFIGNVSVVTWFSFSAWLISFAVILVIAFEVAKRWNATSENYEGQKVRVTGPVERAQLISELTVFLPLLIVGVQAFILWVWMGPFDFSDASAAEHTRILRSPFKTES